MGISSPSLPEDGILRPIGKFHSIWANNWIHDRYDDFLRVPPNHPFQ
jgi:hypothetical protein